MRYALYPTEEIPPLQLPSSFKKVNTAPQVHIIGAGPAGMFAALQCLELGLKPIVLERGKDVRQRRRDLALITKEQEVNPESNYCFGEGGAGTYSDGKLYTRSKKRGDWKKVLSWFVEHGATTDILTDAHPHIGTNKLPQVITAIRETILAYGGEIEFNTKVTNFRVEKQAIVGLELNNTREIKVAHVILATGHSANDIYHLLHQNDIVIEAKPFALGVRLEQPQESINQMQYGVNYNPTLPPASYGIVKQTKNKGVYSFCMCPGGIVAPCATNNGEIVTNGWSPSKRNNAYANSGFVAEVDLQDFENEGFKGPLAGLQYRSMIEQKAWLLAGKLQKAPAQRALDFIAKKPSATLPENSYLPGVTSVNLWDLFPKNLAEAIQEALVHFNQKLRNYITPETILIAPESRTSSPVRIPRDNFTLEHTTITGLYPCAEGAGYAGGIVSAAIDGMRCAQKIAENKIA